MIFILWRIKKRGKSSPTRGRLAWPAAVGSGRQRPAVSARVSAGPSTLCVQSLTASLGAGGAAGGAGHQSLATVCRMSRTVLFPPQFKTLHEWFHYAFADSEIDGESPTGRRSRPERKMKFSVREKSNSLHTSPNDSLK